MATTAAAAANDAAFDDYAADGLVSGAPDLRAALIAALGRHVSPKELRRLAGSAFPSLERAAFGAMADAARAAPPADPPLVRTAAPRVPPVMHAPGGFWRTQQGSELSGQTNPRRFPQQGVAKRRHLLHHVQRIAHKVGALPTTGQTYDLVARRVSGKRLESHAIADLVRAVDELEQPPRS